MGSHCWTYDRLKNLKRFIQNEKQIEGKFTKSFSLKEKKKDYIEQILQTA